MPFNFIVNQFFATNQTLFHDLTQNSKYRSKHLSIPSSQTIKYGSYHMVHMPNIILAILFSGPVRLKSDTLKQISDIKFKAYFLLGGQFFDSNKVRLSLELFQMILLELKSL